MRVRFRDSGEREIDFVRADWWVACPRCDRLAFVRNWTPIPPPEPALPWPERRMVCAHCGYFRSSESGPALPPPVLWLQTPCCGQTLWAYNPEHLTFIENYVRATLREHAPAPRTGGYHNQGLANRLPDWMIDAKHREEVLRAVARIRREKMGARAA